MDNHSTLIPIDFNSFSNMRNGIIDLSDYYIDYAFCNEGLQLVENMKVTFYDDSWRKDKSDNEIMCLNAIIIKNQHEFGTWIAQLEGRVYILRSKPKRKFFFNFIGAQTRLHVEPGQFVEQKLGLRPESDTLDGISVFTFPQGTALPDFSGVIGMSTTELEEFFTFSNNRDT